MGLNSDERKIYNQKRKLIYKRMPLDRKLSPIIHFIVDNGLSKLVQNNNYLFITDMYIDYLEFLVKLEDLNDGSKFHAIDKIYYYGFYFDDDNKFFDKMNNFADFFITRILEKTDDKQDYYEMYQDKSYYKDHWNSIDNKIIFDLYRCYYEIKDPYQYGEEHYIRSEILKMVIAYILTRNDLILNQDLSKGILEYTKNNMNRIEEHLIMNSNLKYEPMYQIVRRSFNPEKIVYEYNNSHNKRLIK